MLTCDSYVTAHSLDQAFEAMAANADRFRLVAGATDLLPWAREGRGGDVHVPVLIDIASIPELRQISAAADRIRIGAATPIQRFLDDPALRRVLPDMPFCAAWFADDQIRESATIGGNIVNASPAADAMPPMLAHNAVVELAASRDGKIRRRSLPLADFLQGPGRTVLEPDEILVAIDCDALAGYGGAFEKVGHRRSLVISVACVSCLVMLDAAHTRIEDIRIAAGGIGPVPVRLGDVEQALRGIAIDAAAIARAASLPLQQVQSRSRRDYRRGVLHGFVVRAVTAACREAGADTASLTAELETAYA